MSSPASGCGSSYLKDDFPRYSGCNAICSKRGLIGVAYYGVVGLGSVARDGRDGRCGLAGVNLRGAKKNDPEKSAMADA
jgi:hypothetical protein